eukprot:347947-Chlamydomonas_euryale.AAC.5
MPPHQHCAARAAGTRSFLHAHASAPRPMPTPCAQAFLYTVMYVEQHRSVMRASSKRRRLGRRLPRAPRRRHCQGQTRRQPPWPCALAALPAAAAARPPAAGPFVASHPAAAPWPHACTGSWRRHRVCLRAPPAARLSVAAGC